MRRILSYVRDIIDNQAIMVMITNNNNNDNDNDNNNNNNKRNNNKINEITYYDNYNYVS